MKVVVIGTGKVGRTIVEHTTAEGHEVVIVDKNEVRVGSVSDLVFDPSGAIASDILLEMRYLRVRTIVVYKN